MAAISIVNMLSFLQLVTYNQRRQLKSYDQTNDGAVPEVFGGKLAGKPVLLFVCTASHQTFADADGNGSCRRTSEAAGRKPPCRQDNLFGFCSGGRIHAGDDPCRTLPNYRPAWSRRHGRGLSGG